MERFEYATPGSRQEAVKLLAEEWGRTEVMAGGTDLIGCMKDYISTPQRVVSLKDIRDLRGISYHASQGLRIGATVTVRELLDNESVKRHYPLLIQSAERIGSQQLRNMGTVGGGLLQRPRCWYYRLGYGLLAQDHGQSLVPGGDNRYHAVLGNSGPAYFVSPSTLAPVFMVLGARVQLYGPRGAREISVEKLFTTPTQPGQREHTLRPNEILTEIIVPHPERMRGAVYEVRQKQTLDWPLSAAVVTLSMNGNTISRARVVLQYVAPVPWPSPEAEQALEGKTLSEEVADAAGQAAVSKATPLSMNGYKVQLTRVAVKRAILRAGQGGA